MALICHESGGNRSSSPLLSLIAMLNIKPRTKTWKEPGNLISCLFGLIWVVQLLIFAASVYRKKSDAGGTLERIEGFCEKFLRPGTVTPIGEILGWRLLLFTVSKEAVGLQNCLIQQLPIRSRSNSSVMMVKL